MKLEDDRKIIFISCNILNDKCALSTCSRQYLQKEIEKITGPQAD